MQMFISTENTKAANSTFTLRGTRSKDASSQGGFLFKKMREGEEEDAGESRKDGE